LTFLAFLLFLFKWDNTLHFYEPDLSEEEIFPNELERPCGKHRKVEARKFHTSKSIP
jgi:hypothetical protein